MLILFYRLGGNDIGFELEDICKAECAFNESLPDLRTRYCVPLVALATPPTGPAANTESSADRGAVVSGAALVPGDPVVVERGSGGGSPQRGARTTVFVARSILLMLGSNPNKLIKMFDATMFPRSANSKEDII